ncbi:MAG TPA: hypothetical protein VMC85_00145 [Desulfomonilaceae bacterium]|nr:hypothetical protein [Desulfomonilaceae bacterium]
MNCHRCEREIPEDDAHEHYGQTLCDDCYMDALSPARSCDPWAVHSAKRLEAAGSQGLQLNEIQSRIVGFLQNAVEAEPTAICQGLQISEDTLKRETAALRHMERIRGRLKDGKVVLRLWDTEVEN